jgi:hypothetical protein
MKNLRSGRPLNAGIARLRALGVTLVLTLGLTVNITLGLANASAAEVSFDEHIQPLLAKYCIGCHGGEKPKGQLDFSVLHSQQDANRQFEVWAAASERLEAGDMPPDGEPQPSADDTALFLRWYRERFVDNVEARPSVFRPRRLSAHEYRNTMRSLLGFDLEVSIIEAEQTRVEKSLVMKLLPTDPPGKNGFRNDTSGNPLTTVIWDQYSYLVDFGLEQFFSDERKAALEAYTGSLADEGISAYQAQLLLHEFRRRAFRRDLAGGPEIDALLPPPVTLALQTTPEARVEALKVELKAVLMSPTFIYRGILLEGKEGQQRVDDFELAERLSYFIWADMPDETLFAKASDGVLSHPEVYRAEVNRMLDSPKARNLATDFGVQWLALTEIEHVSNNPPHADALLNQPIDFINYLFAEDRPLIELIDSKVSFVNPLIAGHYPQDRRQMTRYQKQKGIEIEIVPHQKIRLETTVGRGGILTMPGVLAMNKGPVIRGVWMLERILGEHLPDPPPDVGQIAKNRDGEQLTFRQRFELHRSKPTCALCHDKIDPLGFALQRYDAKGGLAKNVNSAIDTAGRLPTGEEFADYAGLKQILVTSQREKVIRNIVKRTLSFALCRKLEVYDQPTIDKITRQMTESNGTYRGLIHAIANSLPFQETIIESDPR